jgi:carboxyl-terminal processing protease
VIRISALLLSALLAAAQDRPLPDTAELERELGRFIDVLQIAEREAADPLDFDHAFYRGAIPGMLRRLDPHSVFFDKDQFEQLKEMQKSMAKGFGSVVSVLPGRVIVLQTQPGSPSQKAGLSPGDEILAINNIALARLDLEQLVEVLSYTRQKEAQLAVKRPGTAGLMTFTLTPAELATPSVDRVFSLPNGYGYIRATSFDEDTAERLREAIDKLGGYRLKGLVLDLRDNPGGVLPAALKTAALFLKPGAPILSARGRASRKQDVNVPDDAMPYPFPLAVLINNKRASASEIVAGALQDAARARIYGERSFGKGLVQSVTPLSSDTGLALTTAFYYTPKGRNIQRPLKDVQLSEATAEGRGGIEPDEVVYPPAPTRLMAVLEASGSFIQFASEWLRWAPKPLPADFDITSQMIDEYRSYCSNRNIRPSVSEWTAVREFVVSRLLQEILTQSRGVTAGDEIEIRRDAVVRRALESFPR